MAEIFEFVAANLFQNAHKNLSPEELAKSNIRDALRHHRYQNSARGDFDTSLPDKSVENTKAG